MIETKQIKFKNLKTIIILMVVVGVLSLAISLLQTPKYESQAKLIVVFNQENMDIYTAAQTSNYIANVLAEVIYSKSFMDNVLASNFNLQDNFGFGAEKRLKNWHKTVKTEILENKGIILISVLHSDKNQANQLAQAISYTLITKHQLYHGSGDRISLNIIDSPVVSDEWAQPKVLQNTLLGLLAGLLIGFALVIIFPEQKMLEYIKGGWRQRKNQPQMKTTEPDEEIVLTPEDFASLSATQDEQKPAEAADKDQTINW